MAFDSISLFFFRSFTLDLQLFTNSLQEGLWEELFFLD